MKSLDSPLLRIAIAHTWSGMPAERGEHVTLAFDVSADHLRVHVDAPWHADALPDVPKGRCDGLWEYEVVELFLLGADDRYLELELGPGGHHLALELHGPRRRLRGDVPVAVECEQQGARWSADVRIERRELPPDLRAWNAYAIHGVGAGRRYLALHGLPGERPDFHQLSHFPALPEPLRRALTQ